MEHNLFMTLKKNQLDLEHQVLLQNRSAIWILETTVPLSFFSIAISEKWYIFPQILYVISFLSFIVAFLEFFRRKTSRAIYEKQLEIEKLTKIDAEDL